MEKVSDKEIEEFKRLQAKIKRVKRQEEQFFKDVEERREEVLERLGVEGLSDDQKKVIAQNQAVVNELKNVARLYGATVPELFKHLKSQTQIDFYKKYHK